MMKSVGILRRSCREIEIETEITKLMGLKEAHVRSMPPIYVKFGSFGLDSDASLERDDVSCVEFFLFDETAPSFGHHVALA